MGLDVYVKWPGMTDEEERTQITGFRNAGEVGYLRQSWGSLGCWDDIFQQIFGLSWSEMLYPGWDGGNDGNGPDLTKADERRRLESNRDRLQAYVNRPTEVPEALSCYFTEGVTATYRMEVVSNECQNMIAFINLALSKDGATINFS